MKTDSVTAGKTRVLLVAALAFMAQGAWSEERSHARAEAPALIAGASETVTSAPRPVEIDIAAYIEAFNKRLTEARSKRSMPPESSSLCPRFQRAAKRSTPASAVTPPNDGRWPCRKALWWGPGCPATDKRTMDSVLEDMEV
jgi:hypothetical protein